MKTYIKFVYEYLKSDSSGYNVGEYLYHVTPKSNMSNIKKNGFKVRDGVAINGKPFENRLYFATSLISAYDLSVNFGSFKENEEYIIFKLKSNCLHEYDEDPLFLHGIYVDYPISNKYIIEIIDADDLWDNFSDEDIENLY